MQTSSLPSSPVSPGAPGRERFSGEPRESFAASGQKAAPTEPPVDVIAPQRVIETIAAERSRLRDTLDSVDPVHLVALKAYTAAGPGAEERLGVELVGIDVYA